MEPERFHPFALRISNRDTCEMRHPEQVIVGRSTVTIGTQRRNGLRLFQRLDTVSLPHVVSIVSIQDTEVL